MHSNRHWHDQTLARFIRVSRRHLGLMQAPVAVRPPRRVAGPCRQILRSLLVAGSLGALFGGPAFATEASRPPDPAKRSPSAHSTRANGDERPDHSPGFTVDGKYR